MEREQTKRRYEQITEIAGKLFAEKGYHGSSLDDVAKKLDVTRASLYYYIKSKEDLLREICDNILDEALKDMHRTMEENNPPSEKLKLMVHDFVLSAIDRPELCEVLFEQVDSLGKKSRRMVRRKMKEFDDCLMGILEDGVRQGEFEVEDVRIAAYTIMGACFWPYRWYSSKGRVDKELVANHVVRLVESAYIKPKAKASPAKRSKAAASKKLKRR